MCTDYTIIYLLTYELVIEFSGTWCTLAQRYYRSGAFVRLQQQRRCATVKDSTLRVRLELC